MISGKNGVTSGTPKNIMFGAGTIHKNLTYSTDAWNFEESLIGATNGGSKVTITPEITPLEIDGMNVSTKNTNIKTGEVAEMEINLTELTSDIVKSAIFGTVEISEVSGYDKIVSKTDIEEGDYWDNIAFVGKKLDGSDVIVILNNALCTSGLESEGSSKSQSVGKYTFSCNAELTGDLNKLPYEIYMAVGEEG